MLKTKNATYKVILIVALICIVAALVESAICVSNAAFGVTMQVVCVCNIAALIYAAFYILAGYNKDNANFYKIFGAIYALAQIVDLAFLGTVNAGYVVMLFAALILAAILVLVFSKDLGKQKSMTICIVLVALTAALTICAASGVLVEVVGMYWVKLVLACLYTLMTFAKYVDKAARGSK